MASTARERAVEAFERRFGAPPEVVVRAPGRVNLVGEHVDYNGGLVLPAAIDRASWLAASPASGGVTTVDAVDLESSVRFVAEDVERGLDRDGVALPGWARYPAGVAWSLGRQGLAVPPMSAVLASDVPIGAGLSSSAAIEVAFAAAWQRLGGWSLDRFELAKLCQRGEAEYVGIRCGLMDPFASLHGRRGHALLLDCRTLEWKPVPLPDATAIVIADTGVRRALATSEFNLRRRQCEEAVARLRGRLPEITSLRDVSPEDFARHRALLPDLLERRARHVVEEIARVAAVIPEVERGDARALGRAMTAAHVSGRDLYDVSCRELDVLVDAATALDGCYGARLTGAGFGGCTVSLVAAAGVDRFVPELRRRYREETGREATLWVCQADEGMEVTSGAGARDRRG